VRKILFVCLGNICRSPAAEAVMIHALEEAGLSDKVFCDSAGTQGYHSGEPADRRMRSAGTRRGLKVSSIARQVSPLQDFREYDFIIAMDESNYRNLKSLGDEVGIDLSQKLLRMCDFCIERTEKEVPDPYYGGEDGFENVLDLLKDASTGLMAHIRKEWEL
jgi:protein-tyrosine phosphatase